MSNVAFEEIKKQRRSYGNDWQDCGFTDRNEALEQFDELLTEFSEFPEEFRVYRGMSVSKEWLQSIHNGEKPDLGVHWSWDEGAARTDLAGTPHDRYVSPENRKDMVDILLVATVKKKDVNWDATFHKNMGFACEAEIHISEAEVFLETVVTNGAVLEVGQAFPTGKLVLPDMSFLWECPEPDESSGLKM